MTGHVFWFSILRCDNKDFDVVGYGIIILIKSIDPWGVELSIMATLPVIPAYPNQPESFINRSVEKKKMK